MHQNRKNIMVTVIVVLWMLLMAVLCTMAYFHPVTHSESERRQLAQFPGEITWTGLRDKTVMDEFEEYTLDQFPFREFFRSVKAHFQLDVLRLKENNGMAVEDGYIAKIEPEFNEGLVEYSLGRLEYIYDEYVEGNGGRSYVAIVPDKNYFFAREYGYPLPDYGAFVEKVRESLPGMTYIDLFDCLKLTDYYRTDTHWSQDRLGPVVDKLATKMGSSDRLSGEYTEHRLEGFEGVYYSQSALYPQPDTLVYLTNDILDACTVYDYETGKTGGIYDKEQFQSEDGYNVFLSGTKALLRIDNPNADTDKELVIFRDSFGSSLAPLLAEGYKSVYLVDIRYVAPEFLGNLMDLEGKDVLYLYSTQIFRQKAFK
ncbi:MAG: DHHW family protein [Lachnospiraceae bacterium]